MWYRVKQYWWLWTARELSAEQLATIEQALSPAEWQLFQQFSKSDKQHSYRVFDLLHQAGHTNPDLLTAALLHDIGKTRLRITWIDRVISTLGSLLVSKRAQQWGLVPPPYGWRKPFVIKAKHPAWGAEMAQQINSRPTAIALIAHHQDKNSHDDRLLELLQWADDQC